MKQHLPWMALCLGFGAGAASAQDIVQWGLDGLNLAFACASILLVYIGAKRWMNSSGE